MSTAVTNDEIAARLAKHDARQEKMAASIERMESELEPIIDLYDDIAAVGRFGRTIGNMVKWFAGIGLACAALWATVKGHKPW